MPAKITFITAILISLFASQALHAQQGFNYQAALRNSEGKPIADSAFTMTVNIISGSIDGEVVYTEEHQAKTNSLGLFSLVIGQGETFNDFSSINWKEAHFIGLEINGTPFSISPLMSVPYAMHAFSADKLSDVSNPVEKSYTDSLINVAMDKIDNPGNPLNPENPATKQYVDNLLENLSSEGLKVSGDTLKSGNENFIIPGLSAMNSRPYNTQRTFGGTGNESIKAAIEVDSGKVLIIAETTSENGDIENHFGTTDIWLFEVDENLSITKQTTLGGSNYDNFSLYKTLPNGNLLLTGTTESASGSFPKNNGKFDIWLAEVNPKSLEIIWTETYGGSQTEFINSLVVFNDGSFVIGGSTFSDDKDISYNKGVSDIWAMKLDHLKTLLWKSVYGDLRFESLFEIVPKENGNLIFIGSTESNNGMVNGNNGGLDVWLFETDKDGNFLKQLCIGTAANEEVRGVLYENQTLTISGISFSSDWDQAKTATSQNVFLAHVSDNLELLSMQNFGGTKSEWPVFMLPNEQSLLILGTSASGDGDIVSSYGDRDFWLLQVSNGTIDKSINFGGSLSDEAHIIKVIDGGYLIAGTSESKDGNLTNNHGGKDIWVIKTDADFNVLNQQQFGGSGDETVFGLKYENGTLTLYGTTESDDYGIELHGKKGSNCDIWIVKIPF